MSNKFKVGDKVFFPEYPRVTERVHKLRADMRTFFQMHRYDSTPATIRVITGESLQLVDINGFWRYEDFQLVGTEVKVVDSNNESATTSVTLAKLAELQAQIELSFVDPGTQADSANCVLYTNYGLIRELLKLGKD